KRYNDKLSGPVLDRIDIHIEVAPVEYKLLRGDREEEKSEVIRERVNRARAIQTERFKGTSVKCNAKMTPSMTRKFCTLSDDADKLLQKSFDAIGMSPRAHDKILRISRTIADLEGSENIELSHVAEAIQYRALDRVYKTSV
ncbi:MAG: ATP-binding protein, partial [Eubacterium sp.]|nr:ATP-binding protein [Eubacterium sp.]